MKPHKSIAVAVSLATLLSLGIGGTALADEPANAQSAQSSSSSVKAGDKSAADSNANGSKDSKDSAASDAPAVATKPAAAGDAAKLAGDAPASASQKADKPAPATASQLQNSNKNQPAAPQSATKDSPATSNDKQVNITVNLKTVTYENSQVQVPAGLFDTTLHADTVYLDVPQMLGKTAMVDLGNGNKGSIGFVPLEIHFKSVEGEDIVTAPGNTQSLTEIDPQAGEAGHTTFNGTIAAKGLPEYAYKWYNQEVILRSNINECNKMLTSDLYYHHADFVKLQKDVGDALDEADSAELPAANSDPNTWTVTKLNKTLEDDQLNTKNTQPTIIWTHYDSNADGVIDANDVSQNPGRYVSRVVLAEQNGKPFAGWAKSADGPVEFAPDVAIPIDSLTLKDAATDTYVCDYMPVYRDAAADPAPADPSAPAPAPAPADPGAPSAPAASAAPGAPAAPAHGSAPAASAPAPGSSNKPAAAVAKITKDPSDPGQLGKTGTAVSAIAGVAMLLMFSGAAAVVLRKRMAAQHAAE